MDQFDAAWKLLAGNHPEAFLRLFAPDLAAQVDWNQQYCLPDHELVPPASDSRSATRHPDIPTSCSWSRFWMAAWLAFMSKSSAAATRILPGAWRFTTAACTIVSPCRSSVSHFLPMRACAGGLTSTAMNATAAA
jgi:hypothetical protein